MNPLPLGGKRVVVYGLGKSGLAAVKLLLREKARVTVVDQKPADEVRAGLSGLSVDVGTPDVATLSAAELVIVSPGVPLANPELVEARKNGVRMFGEVELASRFLEGQRIVGITGTNGKSTTTALTGELLRAAGQNVFVGGNLGTPLSEAVLSGTRYDTVVVELSSFQLEGIEKMRLSAGALLNLQPDHLDRYPNMKAYAEAKARIWMNQQGEDVAVVNLNDGPCVAEAKRSGRPVWGFAMEGTQVFGDYHRLASGTSDAFRVFVGSLELGSFRVRNKALRGAHNVQNAMAAALLAMHAGADSTAIQKGLDSYPGLPHRMEFVRELDGVEWINDSKATNVDSSLVALAAFREGVWLIAGGKGKGAPYAPMVAASKGRVKGVLTVGKDAPTIEEAYRGVIPVHPCEDLKNAVARARELAKRGDTVLLSPACASYDQFKNFEDRGEQFKAMVRAL